MEAVRFARKVSFSLGCPCRRALQKEFTENPVPQLPSKSHYRQIPPAGGVAQAIYLEPRFAGSR
jgi:hypothetical protein